MRALDTDASGDEVLVGLTRAETEEMMAYQDARMAGAATALGQGRRYLELHDRHELRRLQVLGAEHQLRVDNPPRH
jgi:hypothetical protein